MPAIVYAGSFAWEGLGTVTVTVDDDAPGYEDLYHWVYHVQNDSFGADVGQFAIEVGDPEDVGNLGSSLGWEGAVASFGGTNMGVVHWNSGGLTPRSPSGGRPSSGSRRRPRAS